MMSTGMFFLLSNKICKKKTSDLRFKNVNAAINKTLKRRENPTSAPMQIQNQYSSTKKPLALRRTFPTVGSLILGSVLGCIENMYDKFNDGLWVVTFAITNQRSDLNTLM